MSAGVRSVEVWTLRFLLVCMLALVIFTGFNNLRRPVLITDVGVTCKADASGRYIVCVPEGSK